MPPKRQDRRAWLATAQAAPFLLAATFIKSPVVFPFILFYAAYAALRPGAQGIIRRDAIVRILPFIFLSLMLLAVAVLAEQLRCVLLDLEWCEFSFAQGAGAGRGLFFGTWELRADPDFWKTIWARANVWGPFSFAYVYLGIAAAALVLKPDRQLAAVTAASIIAFFGSWLILSAAYEIHDYYQLSVAIIVFISFGASLSRIAAFIRGKLPAPHHSKAVVAAFALAAGVLLSQLPALDSLSGRHRVKFWNAVEYALRNETVFLFIPADENYLSYNPQVGGFASTKFRLIKPDNLEANCEDLLAEYAAVLSLQPSNCLIRNKARADIFIQDEGRWESPMFYLNRRE